MSEVDELAKKLWDFHHVNHRLEKADAIVVLGGSDVRTAERGIELFLEGYAPLLVITGGYGRKTKEWDKSEAEIFADMAAARGVPRDHMILETKSTNTGENIQLTKKLLADRGVHLSKIIAVQKPYTERRLLAALERQWPEVRAIIASPEVSFEEYPNDRISKDDMINAMISHLKKLIVYPSRGFQTPVDIPADVMRAYERLVELGYDKMLF